MHTLDMSNVCMSHVSHIWMRVTYERVTSSCPTYAWVTSHRFEWVMSKATCPTYACASCGTWLIHMWHVMWDMSHSYVTCPSCGTCLVHMWHVHAPHVGHDSFICDTSHGWMTHSYVGHASFICGTWLIHMLDMTHSYVGHDSFICGTWLIYMWDMSHSYVTRLTFEWVMSHIGWIHMRDMSETCHSCPAYRSNVFVTWLIQTWDVSHMNESCPTYHSHVRHDPSISESCHTWGWVPYMDVVSIWMSHVTHMDESCHTYGWVMSHI